MSWINEILHKAGQPFRGVLDSIKADVYEYCNNLYEEGATIDETHVLAVGFFEVTAEGNMLQYLYLKYVEDWAEEMDEVDTE